MNTTNNFINWLEGFLDGTKNTLTSSQVKEIRKKISEYRASSKTLGYTAIYDSPTVGSIFPPDAYHTLTVSQNEEYLKEIERNKNASTMEDLQS